MLVARSEEQRNSIFVNEQPVPSLVVKQDIVLDVRL